MIFFSQSLPSMQKPYNSPQATQSNNFDFIFHAVHTPYLLEVTLGLLEITLGLLQFTPKTRLSSFSCISISNLSLILELGLLQANLANMALGGSVVYSYIWLPYIDNFMLSFFSFLNWFFLATKMEFFGNFFSLLDSIKFCYFGEIFPQFLISSFIQKTLTA